MRLLITLLFIIEQVSQSPNPPQQIGAEDSYFWTWLGAVAGVIAAFVGVITLLVTFVSMFLPWLKASMDKRSVMKRISAKFHSGLLASEDSFRYFVEPKCQDAPPSGDATCIGEDARQLFDTLDHRLERPEDYKYLLLLADSGMGKTTALLNYVARYNRRIGRHKFDLRIIPLSHPDSDSHIGSIEDKANTVLILDALDENMMALVDHLECLRYLVNETSEFRCVLISCRTQFFSKDEEIPEETEINKVAGRRAGQKPQYSIDKIYLLPFDDEQVREYLRRRYPFWKRERKQVLKFIASVPQLAARPMLLAYTDDLVRAKKTFDYLYEIYEVMVDAWLVREAKEPSALRQFLELLAVYLYLNREERKSDRISKDELMILAKEWEVSIEDWKLSGRSLLNRDLRENFKFADSSIMEHLFVCRFFRGDDQTLQTSWTDQMNFFLWERIMKQWKETENPWFAPEPFKLLLEHPNGIDTLVKSHTIYAQRRNEDLTLEGWDKFGVSIIATLLYVSNQPKPYVSFMRIEDVSYPRPMFDEQKIMFTFSSGALCPCSEGRLYPQASGSQKNFTIRDYKGDLSAVQLGDDETVKELPREVANCFFKVVDFWITRAFMIRARSRHNVIVAFQTAVPVNSELTEKITRCAVALF